MKNVSDDSINNTYDKNNSNWEKHKYLCILMLGYY